MPQLDDLRHEIFARGLARGLSLRAASDEAKFFGSLTRIRQRSERPAIAGRVAELVAEAEWGGDRQLPKVFDELMRLAKVAGDLKSGAGMVAAKGLLAEAARIRTQLPPGAHPAADIPWDPEPDPSDQRMPTREEERATMAKARADYLSSCASS